MDEQVLAVVVAAVLCGAGGLLVPTLLRRIPEPEPPDEPDQADQHEKEPYAAIAALRGLAPASALAAAALGAAVAAGIGWQPALATWVYLVPVGIALTVVDWRTRLLPTAIIAPSYVVVLVLVAGAAALGRDPGDLVRAGLGWLVAGGFYGLLWLIYPRGMGYGDVRLAGVLGLALGQLGWNELLVGLWAGFILLGVLGGLLLLLRVVSRDGVPHGPFMLLGAAVGVLAGPVVLGVGG